MPSAGNGYTRPAGRPERRQSRTRSALLGRGARRSAEIRRPLRLQGRAGLSGTQIRRPGLAAGREIHRPCGQHSSGTAPRPVPLVALRLLHLEADKRQQCGRNRKTRTRQTQDQNPQRTLARRAHRMGIPDGTLPRLLVAGDRSLRQHRQGDPLCGAGIEKTRSLSVGRASPHGADLPRRAFRTLHAQQRQTRRKADPAMYRTCTAHGWRWTTASNAPTATRRVT